MKYIIIIKVYFELVTSPHNTVCSRIDSQSSISFLNLRSIPRNCFFEKKKIRPLFSGNQRIDWFQRSGKRIDEGPIFPFPHTGGGGRCREERERGGPKCPPVIIAALRSFERRQEEKKKTNWLKMPFYSLEG